MADMPFSRPSPEAAAVPPKLTSQRASRLLLTCAKASRAVRRESAPAGTPRPMGGGRRCSPDHSRHVSRRLRN
jgi:hypothetical protein